MISGVVAYLTFDEPLVEGSLDQIRQHPAFELGERCEHRVPMVLETSGPGESRDALDWLNDLPGIEHVDVAYVHLEDNESQDVAEECS